jgi:signal transduction histidine kinase
LAERRPVGARRFSENFIIPIIKSRHSARTVQISHPHSSFSQLCRWACIWSGVREMDASAPAAKMAHDTAVWNEPIRARINPSSSRAKSSGGTALSRRTKEAPVQSPSEAAAEETGPCFESRTKAFLSTLSDPAFVIRKDGVIAEAFVPQNYEFTLIPSAVVGRSIRDLLPPQLGQQAMHYVEKACRTREAQTFTSQYLLPGRTREFQVKVTLCGKNELLAVVRDVSTQKLLEKEIVEITSREQTRLGQDLHDGLGQHLTGVTFLTRALENRLAAQSLPEAGNAAEIGKLVLQALSQTRNLARGLFPVELESSGLVAGLRELAGTVEKMFSISCKVDCDEDLVIHDQTIQIHLFRLAQEAVNNSVKHGKAKIVQISLKKVDEKYALSITDDGSGFATDAVKLKGLGLRIMNYRAQKIGGVLKVEPAKPCGTVVQCIFGHI